MKTRPSDPTPSDETRPKVACGERKNKGGAPKGNVNAIRHGLKSGSLPKDCAYIENQMNALRRHLEAELLKLKGEVSLVDAALIDAAVRWTRHSALCLRWLRKEGDKLKPLEKLQFSREIARASSERNRALQMMELDQQARSPWDIVDIPSLPSPEKDDEEQAADGSAEA